MKKYVFLPVIFLFLSQFIYSQAKFVDGYIIKNDNDTVPGWIDSGNNLQNAKSCSFKISKAEPAVQYSPADIKAYRLTNSRYYVSKTVTIQGKQKAVFLEYLVQGVVSLYFFEDNDGLHYFVDKGEMIELKNTAYTTQENEEFFHHDLKTYSHEKKEYVGVFLNLFQDSPKTCSEVASKDLDYKALVDLVVDYHNDICASDKCVVYAKRSEPFKLHFGVIGGCVSASTTKGRSNDAVELYRDLKFKSNFLPFGGVYLEMKLPYINNERLFLRYDMTFDKENLNATVVSDKSYVKYIYELSDSKINMFNTLRLKYDFNQNKVRYYCLAGIVYKTAVHSDYSLTSIYSPDSTHPTIQTYNGKSQFLQIEVGPSLGVGLKTTLQKRDFFLDFNYMFGLGTVSDNHFKMNRIGVNLGIQIF